jgi:hypothetical protein
MIAEKRQLFFSQYLSDAIPSMLSSFSCVSRRHAHMCLASLQFLTPSVSAVCLSVLRPAELIIYIVALFH